MENIVLTEEQLKKISADIVAEVKKETELGLDLDNSEVNAKMEKMAEEQVRLANEKAAITRKTDLEAHDFVNEEDQEKAYKLEFADVDALPMKSRKAVQETKMLTSSDRLQLREGKELGQRIEEFKRLNDDAYLIMTMLNGAAQKKELPGATPQAIYRETDIYKMIRNKLVDDKPLQKALAVATSGSGAEWVPTGFSSQVLVTIELQMKIAAIFNSIAMPTNPYTLPVQTGNGEGYLIPESTADEATKIKASTPTTGNSTFNATKLASRVLFS